MPQQRSQALVITVKIVEYAGLVELPHADPRHYLRYLFKRTRSARKSNKRIAEPYHLRLALGHTGCYYQLGQSVVLNVALDKKLRFNSDSLAARREHAVRQLAHKSGARAAVNKSISALAYPSAELDDRPAESRIVALICAEIYCYVHVLNSFRLVSDAVTRKSICRRPPQSLYHKAARVSTAKAGARYRQYPPAARVNAPQ